MQDLFSSKGKEAEDSFDRLPPQSQCLVSITAVCAVGTELDGTRGAALGRKPAPDAKWTQGC